MNNWVAGGDGGGEYRKRLLGGGAWGISGSGKNLVERNLS